MASNRLRSTHLFLFETLSKMTDETFIKLLYDVFISGNPGYNIDEIDRYEPHGIRLIQVLNTGWEPRQKMYSDREWVMKLELSSHSDGPNDTAQSSWDMTTNGEYLCFKESRNTSLVFKVEHLDEQQVNWVLNPPFLPDELSTKREELVPLLSDILVNRMMPFNKLFTGEMEMKHMVHLRMFQKGEHRQMRYAPTKGNLKWVRGQTLSWGSSHGWDITRDGKIACCRVGYDEYYNFIIEPLNEEQVKYYKRKYGAEDDDLIRKAIKGMDEDKLRMMKQFLDKLLVEIDKDKK